jgi:hypothetical protein
MKLDVPKEQFEMDLKGEGINSEYAKDVVARLTAAAIFEVVVKPTIINAIATGLNPKKEVREL